MSTLEHKDFHGISIEKSYADTFLVDNGLNFDPSDPTETICCYVNTGHPNSTVTIKSDLNSNTELLAILDKDYNSLPSSGAGAYSLTTEPSGRGVFLVGSRLGNNLITTITVTTADNSQYSTQLAFGAVVKNSITGSLPPLTIVGLTRQGVLPIPTDPTQYFFDVSLDKNIYSNSNFSPDAQSPVTVTLNDIPVFYGTLGHLTTNGLKVAYALLSEQTDNVLAYFVASGNAGSRSPAQLGQYTPFKAQGNPQKAPLGSVDRKLPVSTPDLITSGSLTPADIAGSGLNVHIPAISGAATDDYVELYLYIDGRDTKSGDSINNILLAKIDNPVSAQSVQFTQSSLAGFDTGASIQVDYQLKDKSGRSKGWSAISKATVDKQYPTILLTKGNDNKTANGSDQDSAYATYFDTDGKISSGRSLNFVLAQDSQATFSGNVKSEQETTGQDGKTPTVAFTDKLADGETVALSVYGAAAKAQATFTFAALPANSLTLSSDDASVPADSISTHTTHATLLLNRQPANGKTVTFTIKGGSGTFVEAQGVTLVSGGKSATAATNASGKTPDVKFVDTKGDADSVVITATTQDQTAPDQSFAFSRPTDTLTIVPDGSNVPADGKSTHTASAKLTSGKAGISVTFALPQDKSAAFTDSGSGYTLSGDKKTVSVMTGTSGTTPAVHFVDTNGSGETVSLVANATNAAAQTHDFTFAALPGNSLTLSPDSKTVPADGISTHTTYATLLINRQPASGITVTFAIKSGSGQFVKAQGVTVAPDGKSATAITNASGITPDVKFVDTKDDTDSVVITATAQDQTAPDQTFAFSTPNYTLTIVPDSGTNVLADGKTAHTAFVALGNKSGDVNVTLSLPSTGSARFIDNGSDYTLTDSNKTVTVKTRADGTTLPVHFVDTHFVDDDVVLTAAAAGYAAATQNFIFKSPVLLDIEIDGGSECGTIYRNGLNAVRVVVRARVYDDNMHQVQLSSSDITLINHQTQQPIPNLNFQKSSGSPYANKTAAKGWAYSLTPSGFLENVSPATTYHAVTPNPIDANEAQYFEYYLYCAPGINDKNISISARLVTNKISNKITTSSKTFTTVDCLDQIVYNAYRLNPTKQIILAPDQDYDDTYGDPQQYNFHFYLGSLYGNEQSHIVKFESNGIPVENSFFAAGMYDGQTSQSKYFCNPGEIKQLTIPGPDDQYTILPNKHTGTINENGIASLCVATFAFDAPSFSQPDLVTNTTFTIWDQYGNSGLMHIDKTITQNILSVTIKDGQSY